MTYRCGSRPAQITLAQVNEDGTVRCRGANATGQLGNNSKSDSSTPVLVSGLSNQIALWRYT
jgi:alpha-tubulin suppressor-like RCC1 family protein